MKPIDSRKIEDLNPYIQSICKEHIKLSEKRIPNSKVITTSTLRNQAKQEILYSYGREDKTKQIVTNAKLVKGHGFGLAYDLAVIINNKAIYKQEHLPEGYPLTYRQIWDIIGTIGESLGMQWAYRWKSFPETCHFDMLEGLTTIELHAGKRPSIWYKNPIDFEYESKPKQTPLEILSSKYIISSIRLEDWNKWTKNGIMVECSNVKALITNFYRYFSGKNDYIEAVNFLYSKQIISSKEFWLDLCVRSKKVQSEYVDILIKRMADYINKQ